MLKYDPRSISAKVYRRLNELKNETPNRSDQKEQKGQSVELYTYLATWGLLRLRAEEFALHNQANKQRIVQLFFDTLCELTRPEDDDNADNDIPANYLRLDWLTSKDLDTSEYLGLTGIGLQVAREFSFWAEAVYFDVNLDNESEEREGATP